MAMTEEFFASAIKSACTADYKLNVGETPEFEYEVSHVEDDGWWQAVVMFQGRDPGHMGTSWTGVAYFRYDEPVQTGRPPRIKQVVQFIEGEPYSFTVQLPQDNKNYAYLPDVTLDLQFRYTVTQTEEEGPEYAEVRLLDTLDGQPLSDWARWEAEKELPARVSEFLFGPLIKHGPDGPEPQTAN